MPFVHSLVNFIVVADLWMLFFYQLSSQHQILHYPVEAVKDIPNGATILVGGKYLNSLWMQSCYANKMLFTHLPCFFYY